MVFVLRSKKLTVTINSDIIPCCESGHGECKEVIETPCNHFICNDCIDYENEKEYCVFWWNNITDDEFDFNDRDGNCLNW